VSKVHRATEEAMARLDGATIVEQGLIRALEARYPSTEPPDDWSIWNDGYADAMREVYRAHRNDLDVAALVADALMNRTPWELWDLSIGEPAAGASTVEAMEVLDTALADPRSRTRHIGEAEEQKVLFEAAVARVPDTRYVFNNT
jgi:hypothetical protein